MLCWEQDMVTTFPRKGESSALEGGFVSYWRLELTWCEPVSLPVLRPRDSSYFLPLVSPEPESPLKPLVSAMPSTLQLPRHSLGPQTVPLKYSRLSQPRVHSQVLEPLCHRETRS